MSGPVNDHLSSPALEGNSGSMSKTVTSRSHRLCAGMEVQVGCCRKSCSAWRVPVAFWCPWPRGSGLLDACTELALREKALPEFRSTVTSKWVCPQNHQKLLRGELTWGVPSWWCPGTWQEQHRSFVIEGRELFCYRPHLSSPTCLPTRCTPPSDPLPQMSIVRLWGGACGKSLYFPPSFAVTLKVLFQINSQHPRKTLEIFFNSRKIF